MALEALGEELDLGTWNLVRHGETVWNRDGRIQGHRHVPLTERGRAQARQLAERLDGQGRGRYVQQRPGTRAGNGAGACRG